MIIIGNKLSPPADPPADERRYSLNLRRTIAGVLPDFPVATCGHKVSSAFIRTKTGTRLAPDRRDGYVTIRHAEGRAHFHGTKSCGSVWICNICSRKVAAKRTGEVREALEVHGRAGGVAYMATLTLPHGAWDDPAHLLAALTPAFSQLHTGKPWTKRRERAGFIGFIRKLEVTHGANGWHPHIHALYLFERDDPEAAAEFGAWLRKRWAAIIQRRIGRTVSPEALDWQKARTMREAGDYVAKWDAAAELASVGKLGRGGSRSPLQIAADYHARRDPRDRELFRSFAEAFKSKRQLTWSRGVRKALLGMPDDGLSDEQLANADDAVEPTVYGYISLYGFNLLCRRGLYAEALELAETLPWPEFVNRMGARGVHVYCFKPP